MRRYAVGALAPSRGKGSKGIVVTATRIPISFCVEFLTRRQPGKILFVSVSPFLMTDFDLVCLVFSRCSSIRFTREIYCWQSCEMLERMMWLTVHICELRSMVDNASNQGKLIPLFPISLLYVSKGSLLSKYWCNANASTSSMYLSDSRNQQSKVVIWQASKYPLQFAQSKSLIFTQKQSYVYWKLNPNSPKIKYFLIFELLVFGGIRVQSINVARFARNFVKMRRFWINATFLVIFKHCAPLKIPNHNGEKGSQNNKSSPSLIGTPQKRFSKGNRNVFLVTKVLASCITFTTDDIS